jgi:soluble lytic murein transglycosylase-like protein
MMEVRVSQARRRFPDLMGAVIQQESGGRAGAVGPETPYGRALGMSQMLPATAREMAGKLGLPYREDLLRGTDEQSAQYQRRLGEAYLHEGLTRYGDDHRRALMYYHGGPDERMWGPKTRAYADQTLRRLRGR